LVYLDYNGFQRGFDDPTQIRIQMEALACQEIFSRAESNTIQLAWSFMHQDETLLCPFPVRQYEALRLATLCKVRVGPTQAISLRARSLQEQGRLSAKDALHVACAVEINADYFLTCDDPLMRKAQRLQLAMIVLNPVDYVRLERTTGEGRDHA
jgi:predicted nucleic acid-binding protein